MGGVDLVAPVGSDVKSAAIGTIAKIGWDPDGYGNYIIVQHIGGYYTLYGHLSAIGSGIKVGSTVGNGESIGNSGNTGGSTGAHLHFEIINANSVSGVFKGSNKIDPTSIYDLNEKLYPGSKSDAFNFSFDNPSFDFSDSFNFKIPNIEIPKFGKEPAKKTSINPVRPITPMPIVPGPSPQPTPNPMPIPNPNPSPSPIIPSPIIPSHFPNTPRL